MYIRNLLYRAKAERSPVWLAAALHAQNPTWTSQAPLLALAIHPVLNLLGWDYSNLERDFFMIAAERIPPAYMQVKTTALRAVVGAYANPRPLDFGPEPAALLAQAGLRYSDLAEVRIEDHTLYLKGYWTTLPIAIQEVPQLSMVEYTMAVLPETRHLHPDFLFLKTLAEFQALYLDAHPFLEEVRDVNRLFVAN